MAKKKLISTLVVARTMTDLAGRDDLTASILIFISQNDIEQINNCNEMLKILLNTSISTGDCPNPSLAIAISDYLNGKIYATEYLKSFIILPPKNSLNKKSENEKKWYEKIYNSKYLKEKISLRTLGGTGRRTFLLKEKNVPERATRSQSYVDTLSGKMKAMRVCACVCVSGWKEGWMRVCVYVCVYACMDGCVYVCLHVRMYV